MNAVTVLVYVLPFSLFLIAALHAYWGLGGHWPGRDGISLARTVVGTKGIAGMPSPVACFAVFAVLIGVGLWPLFMTGLLPSLWPKGLTVLAGWGIVVVFLGRGIAPYFSFWQKLSPEEPFSTLDRKLYGPLCLALGLGFLIFLL